MRAKTIKRKSKKNIISIETAMKMIIQRAEKKDKWLKNSKKTLTKIRRSNMITIKSCLCEEQEEEHSMLQIFINAVEVREWAEEIEFLIIYREVLSEAPMTLGFLEEEELLTSVSNRRCTNLNLKKKINRKTIKN